MVVGLRSGRVPPTRHVAVATHDGLVDVRDRACTAGCDEAPAALLGRPAGRREGVTEDPAVPVKIEIEVEPYAAGQARALPSAGAWVILCVVGVPMEVVW